MSGLTPIPIAEFQRCLRARGSSMSALAAEIGVARNTLWRALRGETGADEIRKRVHACTTEAEWAHLIQLEHWATWNTAQLALSDASRPWLMRSECMHCRGDRHFVPSCRVSARGVTSGLCPDCLRTHYPEFAADVLAITARKAAA
jgi:hypothetical protein